MKLLHIDSSILGPQSVSRRLSAEIVAAEQARHPGLAIVRRDLAATPLPHVTGAYIGATRSPGAGQTQPSADLAEGFQALDEFLAADVVVVGAPMYNFGIPSQLKAWIDRLAVPGKTFAYSAEGPKGLAGGKRVVIASARGGIYSGDAPAAFLDHQETYLRGIFGFMGITDVTIIRAEGIAMGPDARDTAIAAAEGEIASLAA